jgi:hypothetical protein
MIPYINDSGSRSLASPINVHKIVNVKGTATTPPPGGGTTPAGGCDVLKYDYQGDIKVGNLDAQNRVFIEVDYVALRAGPTDCKTTKAQITIAVKDERDTVLSSKTFTSDYRDQKGYGATQLLEIPEASGSTPAPKILKVFAYIRPISADFTQVKSLGSITVDLAKLEADEEASAPDPGSDEGADQSGSGGIDSLSADCEKEGFVIKNGLCVPPNPFGDGEGLASSETLGEAIATVLKVILGLSGLGAVFFIALGGAWYLGSGGNPDMVKKGKATAFNAAGGLVWIILSYVAVNVLTNELIG